MDTIPFLTSVLTIASEIARENFGKVTGTTKTGDSNQVLTETDLAIGKYLISEIEKVFPHENIIDEEAGIIDKKSERTWVIDPIDGTSNFANGLPHYGIMLGLLEGGQPTAGGVILPYFKELYTAEKGKGAYCDGVKIVVSTKQSLSDCLIAYGIDGHRELPELTHEETKTLSDIILSCRNIRTSNSAFDMMMVACRKYDAYLNKTTKIWDNVAPEIIVTEAGGEYTDYSGKPMDYSYPLSKAETNFTVLSASPILHQQLLELTTEKK